MFQRYLKATSVSSLAKIFTAFGALALIWLINDIEGKETFGAIMLAFSLYYVIATAIASTFQSIIIYHTSRDHDKHNDKTAICLTLGAIIGIIAALLLSTIAKHISGAMNQPEALIWFQNMAWLIPTFTLNAILTSHYRAKQHISTMVIFFEIIPMAVRLIILTAILFMNLPTIWIAHAFTLSYALPFIILYIKKPYQPTVNINALSIWDMRYGAQAMLGQLLNKSIRNIVIFVLGFYVTAGAVADFTLAMRLGQFLQMPKLAIAQLQIPRMGQFLKSKDTDNLLNEFNIMRSVSLALTLFGTAAFIIATPIIFTLFDQYQSAFPIFVMLASASIIRAGFGAIGGYMTIAGYSGYSLISNLIALIILIALLLITIPIMGAMGAAISLTFAALLSMTLMAVIMIKKENSNTFSPSSTIAMILSVITLSLYAIFYAPTPLIIGALLTSATIAAIPLIKIIKREQNEA